MQWRHPGPALKIRCPDKSTLCEDLWEGLWPPWKQGTLWKTHTESVWWQSLNGLGRTVSSVGLWERDGWGLWIKLEEDDTWRVLVVAGGGLATKQLRDGKAQEEAICEHTVWYLNGSGETRGNQLQAKDSVKSYRKWFKTTETWRGLRVGLLFSSKQPLNLWCPVHRDYETIHRQVKEVMLVFYI